MSAKSEAEVTLSRRRPCPLSFFFQAETEEQAHEEPLRSFGLFGLFLPISLPLLAGARRRVLDARARQVRLS